MKKKIKGFQRKQQVLKSSLRRAKLQLIGAPKEENHSEVKEQIWKTLTQYIFAKKNF